MEIIKTANGKAQIKLSKSEWFELGQKSGWIKKEANFGDFFNNLPGGDNFQAEGAFDEKFTDNKEAEMKAYQDGQSSGKAYLAETAGMPIQDQQDAMRDEVREETAAEVALAKGYQPATKEYSNFIDGFYEESGF